MNPLNSGRQSYDLFDFCDGHDFRVKLFILEAVEFQAGFTEIYQVADFKVMCCDLFDFYDEHDVML